MPDRTMHPTNPAETALADQRHAEISAIVDRLTQTPPAHQGTPTAAWIDLADAVIHEAVRDAVRVNNQVETALVSIAAEALRRLTTQDGTP